MQFFFSLFALPMILGGGRRYFEWQLVTMLLGLSVAFVWLVAPYAIWQSLGVYWTLFWLVPMCAIVCGLGLVREQSTFG